MEEKYKEVIKLVFQKSRDRLFAQGHVPMTYFILTETDNLVLVVVPDIYFTTNHSLPTETIAEIAREYKAVLVIFVAEAWMVVVDHKDELDLRPSKHPDKKECLTLVAMDSEGKSSGINGEILTAQGQPYVQEWNWIPDQISNEIKHAVIQKWEV